MTKFDEDRERDPAMQPVDEAGGGESEGFEQSEQALENAATHAEPTPSPESQAFTPEEEADRATAEDGEADSAAPEDL